MCADLTRPVTSAATQPEAVPAPGHRATVGAACPRRLTDRSRCQLTGHPGEGPERPRRQGTAPGRPAPNAITRNPSANTAGADRPGFPHAELNQEITSAGQTRRARAPVWSPSPASLLHASGLSSFQESLSLLIKLRAALSPELDHRRLPAVASWLGVVNLIFHLPPGCCAVFKFLWAKTQLIYHLVRFNPPDCTAYRILISPAALKSFTQKRRAVCKLRRTGGSQKLAGNGGCRQGSM